MKPKITIITPFLNSENFVNEYINMLKKQTFKDWICFLIDDGSTDLTFTKIKKIIQFDPRFILKKGLYKKLRIGQAKQETLH